MKKILLLFFTIMLCVTFTACGGNGGDGKPSCVVTGCEENAYKGEYCYKHCLPLGVDIDFEIKNTASDPYYLVCQVYDVDETYNGVAVEKNVGLFLDDDIFESGEAKSQEERLESNNDYSEYEGTAVYIPEFKVNEQTGLIEGRVLAVAGLRYFDPATGSMGYDYRNVIAEKLDISYQYKYPETIQDEARPKQKITIVWDGTHFKQEK